MRRRDRKMHGGLGAAAVFRARSQAIGSAPAHFSLSLFESTCTTCKLEKASSDPNSDWFWSGLPRAVRAGPDQGRRAPRRLRDDLSVLCISPQPDGVSGRVASSTMLSGCGIFCEEPRDHRGTYGAGVSHVGGRGRGVRGRRAADCVAAAEGDAVGRGRVAAVVGEVHRGAVVEGDPVPAVVGLFSGLVRCLLRHGSPLLETQ